MVVKLRMEYTTFDVVEIRGVDGYTALHGLHHTCPPTKEIAFDFSFVDSDKAFRCFKVHLHFSFGRV
jgi:hypothetical protein